MAAPHQPIRALCPYIRRDGRQCDKYRESCSHEGKTGHTPCVNCGRLRREFTKLGTCARCYIIIKNRNNGVKMKPHPADAKAPPADTKDDTAAAAAGSATAPAAASDELTAEEYATYLKLKARLITQASDGKRAL